MTRWLAVYLLHSTAVYACVLVASWRVRTLAAAETLWRSAVVLPLASATAVALSHGALWNISVPVAAAATASSTGAAPTGGLTADTAHWSFGPGLMVTTAWLVIGLLLVVRDVAARAMYLRRLKSRVEAGERAADCLCRLTRRAGMTRVVRLTSSPLLAGPVTICSAEICIPGRCEHLGDRELQALLAHELAHVVRHDNRWLQLVGCLESLFFVQPLHRVARRELQRIAERACDRWAAHHTADPQAMAMCLVQVAQWMRMRRRAPIGLPAMTAAGLTARVEELLDAARRDRTTSRVPALAWACPVVMLGLLLPGVRADEPIVPGHHRATAPAFEHVGGLDQSPQPQSGRGLPSARPTASRQAAPHVAPRSVFTTDRQTARSGPNTSSAEYRAGFEAARRFRAAHGAAGAKAAVERQLIANGAATSAPRALDRDYSWRASLERSLAASR